MAINTFSTLKAAVLAKLVRTNDADASVRVEDWISLAEDELRLGFKKLRLRQGELLDGTYSIGNQYEDFPNDFIGVQSIVINSVTPVVTLTYVSRTFLDKLEASGGYPASGTPKYYTIQNNKFRFSPVPDNVYTANLTYYILESLGTTQASNWLLANHPKLYYKATLAEAYDYYEDDERYAAARGDMERLFNAAYISDGADQQGSAMRIRPSGSTP